MDLTNLVNQSDIFVNNNLFPLILIYGIFLSTILRLIYIKFSFSISEKKVFGYNLIFLTLITILIITSVKSSLALSLGLVGALSIVRFRTAIKNPEELVFLFFALAIGVGLGANQIYIVTSSFIIFCFTYIFIGIRGRVIDSPKSTISIISNNKINVHEIFNFLVENRLDMIISHINVSAGTKLELFGYCSYEDFDNLDSWIKKYDDNIEVEYFSLTNSD